MTRKLGAVIVAVVLGWLVLFAAPTSYAASGQDDPFAETCDDARLDDVDLPATCFNGEWVHTGPGDFSAEQDAFDDDFDADKNNMVGLMILVFVVIAALGIGGTVWRMSTARSMARRSGLNEDDASDMALLSQHGLEATYIASMLKDHQAGQAAGTVVPTPAAMTDAASRLRELQRLHDQGLVTADEYEVRRKAIIDSV